MAGISDSLFSVIIPTYQRPETLVRAVRSIRSFAGDELEVIVADQSQDEATKEAVLAMGDDRVCYCHLAPPNKSRASNTAARLARGEVLIFADDDVIVTAKWMDTAKRTLGKYPNCSVVVGPIICVRYKGGPSPSFPLAYVPNRSKDLCPRDIRHGFGACTVIRRATFEAIGGYDERLGPGAINPCSEDWDLVYRARMLGHGVRYERAALVYHDWIETPGEHERKETEREPARMAARVSAWMQLGGPGLLNCAEEFMRFMIAAAIQALRLHKELATCYFRRAMRLAGGIPLGIRLGPNGRSRGFGSSKRFLQ
jgi:glycosyltransferase involved in cell wall biosynthesis